MNTEQMIIDSQIRAKWNEQKKQMERAAYEIDFLENRQWGHMKDIVNKHYQTGDKQEAILRDMICLNFTDYIVDKLTPTFKEGVDIVATQGSEQARFEAEELIKTICKNANLKPTLKEADKYAEVNQDVHILPVWDIEKQAIRYDLIPRSISFVEENPNNTKEIVAFYYNIGIMEDSLSPNKVNKFRKITKDYYVDVEISNNGKIQEIGSTKQANPYGEIPAVNFSPVLKINSYWSKKKSPIIDYNISLNLSGANTEVTYSRQSYAVGVLTGAPMEELKSNQVSIITPKADGKAGIPGDYKYVNPGIDLKAQQEIQEKKAQKFANLMHVSASIYANNQESYSSGYHLQLAMAGIIEHVNQKIEFYDDSVQRLISLTAKIYTQHTNTDLAKFEFKATINKLKIESSEAELVANNDRKLAQGITSPLQILIDDYDYTEEEAQKLLDKIAETNKARMNKTETPILDLLNNNQGN